MKLISRCFECGSDDLEWMSSYHTDSAAQNGRLCLSDIKTVYYLACHNCSETLEYMTEAQALTLLNGAYFK